MTGVSNPHDRFFKETPHCFFDLRRYSDEEIKGVVGQEERLGSSGDRTVRYVASGSDKVSREDLVESVQEAFDQGG